VEETNVGVLQRAEAQDLRVEEPRLGVHLPVFLLRLLRSVVRRLEDVRSLQAPIVALVHHVLLFFLSLCSLSVLTVELLTESLVGHLDRVGERGVWSVLFQLSLQLLKLVFFVLLFDQVCP